MLFSSIIFIAYFLPVFLLFYYASGMRIAVLLTGSVVFYVWGEGAEVDIALLPPMHLQPEGGGANSRAVFEKKTIIMNNYWDDMKNRPHVILC
jgi:alginate O-acetyltransferase complex protein AlgI